MNRRTVHWGLLSLVWVASLGYLYLEPAQQAHAFALRGEPLGIRLFAYGVMGTYWSFGVLGLGYGLTEWTLNRR